MRRGKQVLRATLCLSASLLLSCGSHDSGAKNPPAAEKNDDNVLNLFIWSDFMAPNTISSFEKLTGIKVQVSYFDSHEMQEARILAGHSGFDVVDSTGPYFQRQIGSGAYLPLDKTKLPNLTYQDPAIMARVTAYDPGKSMVSFMPGARTELSTMRKC
jgi:putrescine transport system substrate-binding protein